MAIEENLTTGIPISGAGKISEFLQGNPIIIVLIIVVVIIILYLIYRALD